ncbi:hypothetical protein Tco_0545893 [Tanacetum coccineum]
MTPISIRYDSAATLAKAYNQIYNGKFRHLGVRHSMIRELVTNGMISIEFLRTPNSLLRKLGSWVQCEKLNDDEVVNFSMVNFFEKVLSMGMNKEELPISMRVQFIPVKGLEVRIHSSVSNSGLKDIHQGVIHQSKYPQMLKE